MSKFKVGDKVRVRSWESMEKEDGLNYYDSIAVRCSFVKEMKPLCGKTVTISRASMDGTYCIEEGGYFWSDGMFETPRATGTIVIYKKDNTVVALDKDTGETGVAICNAEDEFDFLIGADLAYERLRGRKEPPKEREVKEKFYNGKVCCINTKRHWFTKGKIYRVKDGYLIDDEGDKNHTPFKSFGQLSGYYTSSEFIEVVE